MKCDAGNQPMRFMEKSFKKRARAAASCRPFGKRRMNRFPALTTRFDHWRTWLRSGSQRLCSVGRAAIDVQPHQQGWGDLVARIEKANSETLCTGRRRIRCGHHRDVEINS